MQRPRGRGFFGTAARQEDDDARRRELEALLVPKRTIPQDIGIERILPNPYQARVTFEGVDELAESIRVQGFVSRLRVRVCPDRPGFFQLVYGERRLRAARLAGLQEVPCEVADHTDEEMIEIGLAENIQRRDLNPMEEARALQTFIEHRGYSIRRLAERIGKDKSYVDDRLSLLRAPADVQEMVAQRPDTVRTARELARMEDGTKRKKLVERVLARQLSTQAVRDEVRAAQEDTTPATSASVARPITASRLNRELTSTITILREWRRALNEERVADEDMHRAVEQIAVYVQQLQSLLERRSV